MNIWSSIYEDNVKTSKQFLDPFMKGEHVHLKRGLWKEIWSHVSIKATYMKINKGLKVLLGKKPTSDQYQYGSIVIICSMKYWLN